MRQRLGDANWKAFVRYAEVHYKEDFLRALTPPTGRLCCSALHTVCPADLASSLPTFHMDHTYDVAHICDVWGRALPPNPVSWDDGVCGALVAHLLFGPEDHTLTACSDRPIWRKQIVVRCGNTSAKQRANDCCHDTSNAHYGHVLHVSDIAWPAEEA